MRHFGVVPLLFGSRLDDARRGGDIYLFIPGDWPPEEFVPRRLRFCTELRRCLGDQKIDVVVENKLSSPIQNKAIHGYKLKAGQFRAVRGEVLSLSKDRTMNGLKVHSSTARQARSSGRTVKLCACPALS